MKIQRGLLACFLWLALSARAEELRLKGGTVLQGERVRIEGNVLIFRTSLGEMRIPVDQVLGTRPSPPGTVLPPPVSSEPPPPPVTPPPAQAPASSSSPAVAPSPAEKEGVDPSGQTLVLMPTAFTPPAGTWSFKDFELLFLTLGYAPTSSTSVAVGATFPIDPSQFELFTFGIKQQVFQTPDGQGALAVDGDIIEPVGKDIENAGIWTLSLIGSVEPQQTFGIHGAIGLMAPFQGDGSVFTLALGTDMRLTPHVKFIVEYLRGKVSQEDGAASVINLGFRIHGEKLSADICALRPLEDSGDLFLWPLINIGYRF